MKRLAIAAALLIAAPMTAVAATPSAPSLKPPLRYDSTIVSSKEAGLLREGLRAADRGDWSRVRWAQAQASDQAVRDLLLWRRATADQNMSFDDLNTALARLQGWPMQVTVRINAEKQIGNSVLDYKSRIDWLEFGGKGPLSGPGKVALADAWRAIGEPAKSNDMIRNAWRGNSLDRALTADVLSRYGNTLSQDDHRARADFLLWTNQRSAASRLTSRLTGGYAELVKARIALAARQRNVNGLINAIPADLMNHPGLLYDRARWRRKAGQKDTYIPLLAQIDGNDIPSAGRGKLWDERNLAMRQSIKDREYVTAYQLAAPHGMTKGRDFAEAEWVAGWLALRQTGDAPRAAEHFQSLANGVSTPISLGRANYWNGRALEQMGERDAATTSYEAAASHNFTYYGQLAAERIGQREIKFGDTPVPTETERLQFQSRPIVKALRLLAEAGEDSLFRRFAYHLDDELTTAAEFVLLSEVANEYQQPHVGVRGAKAGLAKGIVAADAAYPLVSYDLQRQPQVEKSYLLALSRQESEMNPKAISHAGARGLMQFMPATASRQARMSGLPYRKSWLTDDPGYNMTLGGQHLDELLRQFNGSYIMTAAAYNAGPSRPKRWVKEYGDPRMGEVDTIDWIEMIPYSETRNYVQRVLENVQVYRHRISGQPEQIQLRRDIERGKF